MQRLCLLKRILIDKQLMQQLSFLSYIKLVHYLIELEEKTLSSYLKVTIYRFFSFLLKINRHLTRIILPARPIYILKFSRSSIKIALLVRLIQTFYNTFLQKDKNKLLFITKVLSLPCLDGYVSYYHLRITLNGLLELRTFLST